MTYPGVPKIEIGFFKYIVWGSSFSLHWADGVRVPLCEPNMSVLFIISVNNLKYVY